MSVLSSSSASPAAATVCLPHSSTCCCCALFCSCYCSSCCSYFFPAAAAPSSPFRLRFAISSIRTLGASHKLFASFLARGKARREERERERGRVQEERGKQGSLLHCNNNYKCCTINCRVNRVLAMRRRRRRQRQNCFLLERKRKCTYKCQTHTCGTVVFWGGSGKWVADSQSLVKNKIRQKLPSRLPATRCVIAVGKEDEAEAAEGSRSWRMCRMRTIRCICILHCHSCAVVVVVIIFLCVCVCVWECNKSWPSKTMTNVVASCPNLWLPCGHFIWHLRQGSARLPSTPTLPSVPPLTHYSLSVCVSVPLICFTCTGNWGVCVLHRKQQQSPPLPSLPLRIVNC